MVASSLAVLRFILVVRISPLLVTALPPLFLGPAFWAVRFLPSLFRGCRRRASSVWTLLSPCGRRRVVGDVLCFCGAELSTEGNFPPSLWELAYTPGKFFFLLGGASFAIIVSWQSSFGRAWSGSAVSRGIFASRGH